MNDTNIFKDVLEKYGINRDSFNFVTTIELGSKLIIIEKLNEINNTLKEMKQQEKEYWETWKQAKRRKITGEI